MKLNKQSGNMYEFITHTANTVKGACPHNCSYCYMKRFGKLNPVRFDEKELKGTMPNGSFIFIGSSCDMWAKDIPNDWILKTLDYISKFDNYYFFQSKNPERFIEMIGRCVMPKKYTLCTTIETNRTYPEMGQTPMPFKRAEALSRIDEIRTYITIEPIMDFDLKELVQIIKLANPFQVNVGADSCNNNLPEPSYDKVLRLINELNKFTVVHKKTNLKRLL